MDESEDWVVTDPDALTEVVENELETREALSRNEAAQDAMMESTGRRLTWEAQRWKSGAFVYYCSVQQRPRHSSSITKVSSLVWVL